MEIKKTTLSGLYLVIDPAMKRPFLLNKVRAALEGGVQILQIWNNWTKEITAAQKQRIVQSVCELAAEYQVPVLINEEWQLLKTTALAGVHFDTLSDNIGQVRAFVGRDLIIGLTCTNDLKAICRAEQAQADYISFCAMFPSPSAGSCEIVRRDTVRKARKLTDLPLFLSGGISPEKIKQELAGLPFNGIAVISGIMKAEDPRRRVQEYRRALE